MLSFSGTYIITNMLSWYSQKIANSNPTGYLDRLTFITRLSVAFRSKLWQQRVINNEWGRQFHHSGFPFMESRLGGLPHYPKNWLVLSMSPTILSQKCRFCNFPTVFGHSGQNAPPPQRLKVSTYPLQTFFVTPVCICLCFSKHISIFNFYNF